MTSQGLLGMLLYPSDRTMSKAMVHERMHEKDAIEAYSRFICSRDVELKVTETGLRIHKQYPFLAASPDRIVVLHGEQGFLEVKCLFSKKGMTAQDASKDSKFCCMFKEGQIYIKNDHAYYSQVHGQMTTTRAQVVRFCHMDKGTIAKRNASHSRRENFLRSVILGK